MRINSLAAKTTGAILVFCGGFGCSSSGQIEIDGASLRDVAPFSDIATDLFSHRSDAVLHDGVAEFGATPDGPVVTGEIDSGAPQDGALPFDANPDLVLSDANPDLVLSDAKSDLVLSDAKSDLVSQLSDSMVAKPRHYLATAPVGDLISLELDPLTNQYTYANQSTGDYETGLFSTDPDGYLIFAQSSFLLAGFEAENVAIVLGASHLGPAKDKTAVVFGIPESPIAKADFSNLPQALVYNSIQFRTSTMGGMEVGRVSIGTDGSLSGDIYEPAHNRISAGTVPFVSVVANGPTGAYLVATYPTSSPSDGQVPDGAGSGSPPETPSYVFRNADNTLLFRDGDTGSHLMALEQGNKALLPSNAGSYRAIYQSGTGDWSSISSVGNVNRGTLQVSESGTVGVQLFDEQNGAHWLWQDKKLLPFADAKMSLKRTTQIFPAETKGLFYAKDDQSETELFVMFSGEMVIFAGLGPKKTAPSQTINGKPKLEEYHFFVGAGIKDSSAPPLANAWHATGPGGGGAWTVVKVSPANPDIAFLGSDVGGLYKTEDGGETWTNANTGLALPEMKSQVYYVNDVGFHPLDPSVMYLSTGGGVFKSGDGGNSWPLRFVHKPVSLLATHAEMPDLVLLGEGQVHTEATTFSSGKIYRSTDALSTAPTTITLPFSADTPTVYGLSLYRKDAASASLSALACTDFGFYESNDAGQSWTYMDSVAAGLPHEDCRAMVVAESQGIISVLLETKFDLVSNDMASWKGGVFRSGDWGATWEAANGNIENNLLTNAAFETAAVNHPGPPLGWIFKGKTPDDNVLRICDSNALLGQGCSLLVDTTNILDSELGSYGVRTADSIAVDGGSRYRISFYAKVAPLASYAGAKSIFARIYWKDANQQYLTPVCMESGMHLNVLTSTDENTPWKRYEVDVIAPADAMSADLDLFSYQVKGQVWFDDVSVRKSHALPKAVNYKKPSGGVGLETAPFVIHYRFLNQDTANPARLRVGIPTAYREPLISGIWGSDDGGLTWEHLTRTCYDTNIDLSRRGQSKEVYSLGIGSDANKSRSYFGTGKWLWRTTDGSQNWQEVTANQNIDGSWSAAGDTNDTFVYGFAFDPNDKDRIYFGDADNCSFVTYDGGQSYFQIGCWDDIGISGDTATSIVVDPADANVLYLGISAHDTIVAGTPGGVAKTVYDGQQWQSQNLDPGGLIRGGGVFLALDPNSSPTNRTLYAGVYSVGIFKTSDGGLSWSSLNQNTWTPKPQKDGIDSWEIYRLAVDGQSGRIFAGFGNPKAGSPADAPESATGIWMSQDGGTNWTKITATSTEMGGEPILALLPIAADKIYTGTWYAKKASGGGLYEGVETNGQWSWQRLLQQPRTVGVGLSHTNGQLIYAASGQWPGPPAGQVAGVYRSENGGQSWSMLDMSGALNLRINQLHVSPKDDTLLFFGTVGGGLFKGVAR